jgi:hypothetical protein
MFFSAHDLTVVLIIAAAAGTVALGAAFRLGHSLVTGSLALREAARAISAGEPVSILRGRVAA